MTATLATRLAKLEGRRRTERPMLCLTLGGQHEHARAEVAGQVILRAADETLEVFEERCEALALAGQEPPLVIYRLEPNTMES